MFEWIVWGVTLQPHSTSQILWRSPKAPPNSLAILLQSRLIVASSQFIVDSLSLTITGDGPKDWSLISPSFSAVDIATDLWYTVGQ